LTETIGHMILGLAAAGTIIAAPLLAIWVFRALAW
jgi:hypothetical protein